MNFTYENLNRVLVDEDFSMLKDQFENELIDVKEFPYNLKIDSGKEELCKDVSAMLNNVGGFILIGVKGEGDLNHRFERIKEVVGLSTTVDEQQYLQCLEHYMYPEEPLISIKKSKLDNKDIFYIQIPKGDNKPYFRKKDNNFQYWIRTGSHATEQKIDRLHEISRKGLEYENHLKNIENNIEELIKQGKNGHNQQQSLSNLKKQL